MLAPIDFSQIRIVGRGVMQGRAVEREGYTQYWWRINQKIMDAAGLRERARLRPQ